MKKNIDIKIQVDLNQPQIINKVTNDRFGRSVSFEWKRLIDPYTPRDTDLMEETARVEPWRIHYIQPYSEKVYNGSDMNFQKENPYSTHHWDVAAANAGQKDKLYRILNGKLQSGQY